MSEFSADLSVPFLIDSLFDFCLIGMYSLCDTSYHRIYNHPPWHFLLYCIEHEPGFRKNSALALLKVCGDIKSVLIDVELYRGIV
jgi:hypothetical protein